VTPTHQGSFRLARVAGINLYLHWSWFVVAAYELSHRSRSYTSPIWNVLEYLSLFGIVLLHEFGHALACRQVGGRADQIVLWPLGGVAYVDPPQRPGAVLWSIAAGPLVNVVLFPILTILTVVGRSAGWPETLPNIYLWIRAVWYINIGLLIFNLMPVYPLDGGQILRSLLWFVLGRARSLLVAAIIGFVGVAGLGVLAAFILMNCWGGLQHALAMLRLAKLPRHDGWLCPSCKTAPPVGELWTCGQCGKPFDTFRSGAVCPHCSAQYDATRCPHCGELRPLREWLTSPAPPVMG
jgi:Zn-dependent protease